MADAEARTCRPGRFRRCADLSYVRLGQLRPSVPFASGRAYATLRDHVSHIVCVRPKEQVVIGPTGGRIASV